MLRICWKEPGISFDFSEDKPILKANLKNAGECPTVTRHVYEAWRETMDATLNLLVRKVRHGCKIRFKDEFVGASADFPLNFWKVDTLRLEFDEITKKLHR